MISDKIVQDFFQSMAVLCIISPSSRFEKNLDGDYTRMLCTVFEQNLESSTPQDSSCVAIYFTSHKPAKWDELDMLDTAEDVRTNL